MHLPTNSYMVLKLPFLPPYQLLQQQNDTPTLLAYNNSYILGTSALDT